MRISARTAALAASLALLAGCSGIRTHRGAVIEPQLTDAIQAGIDNRDSVTKTLGRPTFTGQFNANDWYYVSRDTRAVGFSNEKVDKQTVLHIAFDANGNVTAVDKSGKELVANIRPSSDSTPTLGRKRSFFNDLFSSIGSVAQPGLPGSNAPGQ